MSSVITKRAEQLAVGDIIVRTFHHDGMPKRTAAVAKIQQETRNGHTRYMVTTDGGDCLGWFSATYQFTIERG